MKLKAILFDLDGTLLPMEEDAFTKGYFKLLATKLAGHGYKPDELINAIWLGIKAMMKSDGTKLNVDLFWEQFASVFGDKVHEDRQYFDHFYENEFQQTKQFCGFTPLASEAVKLTLDKGLKAVLATNPVFPAIATESRLRFAGLEPEQFELYTTYENSNYCKPSLSYYSQILHKIGCEPEECLMVGNNVSEDMIAEQLGIKVFLLTDCLVNKEEKDISVYDKGSFIDLIAFIEKL